MTPKSGLPLGSPLASAAERRTRLVHGFVELWGWWDTGATTMRSLVVDHPYRIEGGEYVRMDPVTLIDEREEVFLSDEACSMITVRLMKWQSRYTDALELP